MVLRDKACEQGHQWQNLVIISYNLFPLEYIKKDDWKNVRTHLYTKEYSSYKEPII